MSTVQKCGSLDQAMVSSPGVGAIKEEVDVIMEGEKKIMSGSGEDAMKEEVDVIMEGEKKIMSGSGEGAMKEEVDVIMEGEKKIMSGSGVGAMKEEVDVIMEGEKKIMSGSGEGAMKEEVGVINEGEKKRKVCIERQIPVMNPSTLGTSGYHHRGIALGEPANPNPNVRTQQQVNPYKVNDKVEVLWPYVGFPGCWEQCTVLEVDGMKLKVRFDDFDVRVGQTENFQEWIRLKKEAAPESDRLGIRCSGRLIVRPPPTREDLVEGAFEVGTAVDAWYGKSWCEAVVAQVSGDPILVYVAGEDIFVTSERCNLRISRDWVNNQWVDIAVKPEVCAAIKTAVNKKLAQDSEIKHGTRAGVWKLLGVKDDLGVETVEMFPETRNDIE